ncbi:hypothetical protein LK537_09040 [Lachnoclostridium pacaense]|uniref:hypothetical protein n=1 Tax=Enterocloster hominis (ex Hitch et al. 2024) TaxID=1917870 RepID=UPI001D118462|nr:hypothetical protein [Lachnoclostridium pacaense]MCC2817432.1 hypothetical protein [Lachnoclostridium pacaense]
MAGGDWCFYPGFFISGFSFWFILPLALYVGKWYTEKEHMFFAAVGYESFNSLDFGGIKKAGRYGEDADR